jgi:hypothetical protein|tara:strand:- start:11495 stop:11779 length:285 start_codon:yes stop_codon:yes gene_type:complete
MKNVVEDLITVFEENICNPSVDFNRCFNNFTDILIEIQKLDLKEKNNYSKNDLIRLVDWGNEMLRIKYIDPKRQIGISCVNYREDRSRSFFFDK